MTYEQAMHESMWLDNKYKKDKDFVCIRIYVKEKEDECLIVIFVFDVIKFLDPAVPPGIFIKDVNKSEYFSGPSYALDFMRGSERVVFFSKLVYERFLDNLKNSK
jgi:hypothetical protein